MKSDNDITSLKKLHWWKYVTCNRVRSSYEVILQRKMVLSSKFYILSRVLDYVQCPMQMIGQLHKLLHDLKNNSRKENLFIYSVSVFSCYLSLPIHIILPYLMLKGHRLLNLLHLRRYNPSLFLTERHGMLLWLLSQCLYQVVMPLWVYAFLPKSEHTKVLLKLDYY